MRYVPVLLIVGVIVYGLISLVQARGRNAGGVAPAPGTRPPGVSPRTGHPRGPLAPDDDPEFLAELDRRRRRSEREAAARESASHDVAPPDPADPPEGEAPAARS